MAAYAIVDIEVTNAAIYEEYKRLAPPTVVRFWGRYLARGRATEVLEGTWSPNRLILLEFESLDLAKAWVNSAEYRPARTLCQRSARSNMVVSEGVP